MMGLHGNTLPESLAPSWPGLASVLGHARFRFAGEGGNELPALWAWDALLLTIALVPPNTLEIMRKWQPAITMPAAVPAERPPAGRLDLWRGLSARLNFSLTPLWAFATAALAAFGALSLNRMSEFLYWHF